MIYREPIFRILGEMTLNVEFGDESNLLANFRILALNAQIRSDPPNGLIDSNPQVRTLCLIYDPRILKLKSLVDRVLLTLEELQEITLLPSRRLTIPMWYDDPWSRECAAAFGVQSNIDFIAEYNGLTVQQLIGRHSSCEHWVTGVGFVPGQCILTPLDPHKKISAPYYKSPRTWTHSRTLHCGGSNVSIYPFNTPGGGQLFGRTPLNIWEPQQKNAPFKDGPVLSRAGDRHRYIPIDAEEYFRIRTKVEAGVYDYQIEEDVFDVEGWVRQVVN